MEEPKQIMTQLVDNLKVIITELEILRDMIGTNALLQRPTEIIQLVKNRLYDTYEGFSQSYKDVDNYFTDLKTQLDVVQVEQEKQNVSKSTPHQPTVKDELISQKVEVREPTENIQEEQENKNIDDTNKIQSVNEQTDKLPSKPAEVNDTPKNDSEDDDDDEDDFINDIKKKMK